ncbi:MAG: GvpL/GvpF family gas vesicle protein [Desulfomonile tiedjei]|uniref:GvpL/GvpF family gas vesicle protein n=1 Tax=Desulfomonile tiedjei TaxID=2358 RepID=A0A9D6V6W9_9BACT|nr:GvpL/GvpF family gas vesicle protein [Desulfomonile tiedjei]
MEKTSIKVTGSKGRYLYAMVPGSQERAYGCLGINGGNVYTIADREIAAVVSDVPHQKIRPERRHFAAHQSVLKRLMMDGDLLPMSFGIISNGPKAVRAILSRNNKAVQGQLKRVSGKLEMGLKVSWDVPNIFEYIINTHSELRKARDELLRGHREPTQQDKIEVGQMFEEILSQDRERHTKHVEKVLASRCSEIVRNKCRNENEVMNLSCLVARSLTSEFEAGVFDAAAHFDDNFAFDFNGPWAPHNFVDLEIAT